MAVTYPVPLAFFVFKQTVSHLAAEANMEEVFSRAGQLSEINVDTDALADMRGNKTDFFNSPEDVEDSDTDG